MRILIYIIFLVNLSTSLVAQTGIGVRNPATSSSLEISSTNKGILVPEYNLLQLANPLSPVENPATGSMIFNTTTKTGIPKGYYLWDGGKWDKIAADSDVDELLTIGYASSSPTNYVGSGTGWKIAQFNNISNGVRGASISGSAITLPVGTYLVYLGLNCASPSASSTNTLFSNGGNNPQHLYSLKSVLTKSSSTTVVDVSANKLVEPQVFSILSTTGGSSIQGFYYDYILNLTSPTTFYVMFANDEGASNTSEKRCSHTGFVGTFLKLRD